VSAPASGSAVLPPGLTPTPDDILHDWGDTTKSVLLRDNLCCVYCGLDGNKDLNGFRQLVMAHDHLVPQSRGGRDLGLDNLVTCCWPCNRWKGNFDPRDFKPDGTDGILDPHTPREKMIENVQAYLRSRDFDYYEQVRTALMQANLSAPFRAAPRPGRFAGGAPANNRSPVGHG
jgi:hypothetical protein